MWGENNGSVTPRILTQLGGDQVRNSNEHDCAQAGLSILKRGRKLHL